jgi:CelD/BcsL family acetyltransferase involved in cellulose biosynthesis
MKVTVIPAHELTPGESDTWSDLQRANDLFDSPFFCPRFSAAVGSVRADVFVGIIEEGARVAGFFPFQLKAPGEAIPVGGRLSDYQGVIFSRELEWQVEDLFSGCKLRSWKFDHLLVAQAQFGKYHRSVETSPVIDLSRGGFPQWVSALEARGSGLIKQLQVGCRRLERDHGPIRFEADATDPALLTRLFSYKSAQYIETGSPDLFQTPWITDLIRLIHRTRTTEFGGLLSVLHAGNAPIAYHLGMRSHRVWHWWFPCYDPAYARYHPGQILLARMAEYAHNLGLTAIDLGQGSEPYKLRFMNSAVPLAKGRVRIAEAADGEINTSSGDSAGEFES